MRYDFGEHYTGKKLLRKNKIHFLISKAFLISEGLKTKKPPKMTAFPLKYPGPESNRYGFPQVFETSASTNSATRAFVIWESGTQNYSFVLDWQKNKPKTVKILCLNPIFYYICNPHKKGNEL